MTYILASNIEINLHRESETQRKLADYCALEIYCVFILFLLHMGGDALIWFSLYFIQFISGGEGPLELFEITEVTEKFEIFIIC